MRKQKKQEVKSAIQLCFLFSSCVFGFMFEYSIFWFLVGLPQTTWALWVTALMGILSASGLFAWISKN